jgi:hypothetical protein
MTEVEKAEAIIASLEDKRKSVNLRAVELADERSRIAFSVHGDNDSKSRAPSRRTATSCRTAMCSRSS